MSETLHPEVLWAQRSNVSDPTKNFVYLTITAPDVPDADMKLDIQPTKLTFTGKSSTKPVTYHCELEFFAEIDPAESKTSHTGRDVEMVLRKKELKEEFWPRLLKEKGKVHFLRTDFDKWVDEDEQEDNPDDEDFMNKMGGMGGAGGPPGGNGFEGIDFSKLGAGGMGDMAGMAGMGGMGGMPGMGDMGDEDSGDDDDDDDMPELEAEDEAKTATPGAAKTSAKIEEVE